MSISVEAINVLGFLAPGYLAFRIYMIDSDWNSTRQIDTIYGSLIFSFFGYGGYRLVEHCAGLQTKDWFFPLVLVFSIVAGLMWRYFGHSAMHKLLYKIGITNEDNKGNVWQKIFNDPRLYVTQITAYLKNGEAIQCDDTAHFDTQELRKRGIFPYYTHRDGQISFIPNLRKAASSNRWTRISDVEAESDWGIRMVYISPEELQRLELRITPVRNN